MKKQFLIRVVIKLLSWLTKSYDMFGLFKKKSEIDKLEEKYEKLSSEAYTLSISNRKLSDSKTFEANEVLKEIELLKSKSKK